MVHGMERAVTFYRDVMGLEEVFSSDDWSELVFGDAIVALHSGGDGSPSPTGLNIQVEDIQSAYQDISEAGCDFLAEPEVREGELPLLTCYFSGTKYWG